MPSNWRGLIKAQFIGYEIFKAGGLIRKYLNHSSIKELKAEEWDYLKKMAGHPWRFSFGEIHASPEPDFYEMEDVFTGDLYVLYSRSMSQTLSEYSVLLWFNLIGYNGHCWQTYGPVIPFKSFSPDDIFFYATEVDPGIGSEADLTEELLAKLNKFMALALPCVNSDKKPDVDALAKEAGVDPEAARGLLVSASKKIKEMRK